jgi:predicted cupin superfamily sugar epimerase
VHEVAAKLIERFGMERLPVEDTFFASTYRSEAVAQGGAPAGTAIVGLYLDDPPSRSLFHRLAHDEVWHFYAGDPIRLVLLHPDGSSEAVLLGGDVADGGRVQHVIRAGTWQAGELVRGGAWALFGCTMAPGFTGRAFEGGRASELLAQYPARAEDIRRLGIADGESTEMPELGG